MKKNTTIFALIALIFLVGVSSCSVINSSGVYNDGIYSAAGYQAKEFKPKESPEVPEELIKETIRLQRFAPIETRQLYRIKNNNLQRSGVSGSVSVGYGYGYPYAGWNSWYGPYGGWDPYWGGPWGYWDPYWGPWGYDPWYWRWGWRDPWCRPWGWYGPWGPYGPYGPWSPWGPWDDWYWRRHHGYWPWHGGGTVIVVRDDKKYVGENNRAAAHGTAPVYRSASGDYDGGTYSNSQHGIGQSSRSSQWKRPSDQPASRELKPQSGYNYGGGHYGGGSSGGSSGGGSYSGGASYNRSTPISR